MIIHEVSKRAEAAKAKGHAYLLVCMDTFDRLRGDGDLGYYYPTLDTAKAVRDYLHGHQLGNWNPSDLRDWCEAIVDLDALSDALTSDMCKDPREWLEERFSLF